DDRLRHSHLRTASLGFAMKRQLCQAFLVMAVFCPEALAVLTITTTPPLPAATLGVEYSRTLIVSGAVSAVSRTLFAPPLAPGLSLDSTGTISGTPTTAVGNYPISYPFTIEARDQLSFDRKQFTIVVDYPPVKITTTPPLPAGTVGVAYSLTFAATGGNGSY